MLTYNCSVCQGCYDSVPAWLHHLLQEGHQNLARMELLQWGKEVRSRVLVIFGVLPFGKDVGIIEKLSRDGGGGTSVSVVTDFVWWEGRAQVGFVQFESRNAVNNVLTCPLSPDRLWRAVDGDKIAYSDWMTLLSDCVGPRGGQSGGGNGILEEEVDPVRVDPAPKSEEEMLKLLANVKQETSETDPEEFDTAEAAYSPISTSGSFDDLQENLRLHQHLVSIRKLIEIPDQEYNTALDIAHCLQEALIKDQKDGDPLIKAVLTRHWLFKLKYSGGSLENLENVGCVIIVCKYVPKGLKMINMGVVRSQTREIFDSEEPGKYFSHYEVVEVEGDKNLGMGSDRPTKNNRIRRYRFVHQHEPGHPFWMNIALKPVFPAETQVYNLVRHLCMFDPRCYPVLSVAFYWANINSVAVGKSYKEGCAKSLEDPCGLSWLLIFFFQMEGLIPTTREVLERPHEPVFNGKRDVGFAGHDTTWWRGSRNMEEPNSKDDGGDDMFAEEVFTLLYKFFLFCDAQLGGGSGEDHGWILNTRDSEKLSIRDVLADHVSVSKLAPKELQDIRKGLEQEGSKCDKLVMLQPFSGDWKRRISCSNAWPAFKKMKKTGTKLKEYFLQKKDEVNNVKRETLEFDEFLKLLKL